MKKLFTLLCLIAVSAISSQAQTVIINTGTAGTPAYNAGPVYRSAATSAFDASRYTYLYSSAELVAAGITTGAVINLVGWVKNNTATTTGGGIFRIYMKNTSAASFSLPTETWANLNTGAVLVYENLNQNIPATSAPDYIDFPLTTSFTYTGGSLEISTEWDINQVAGSPTTGTFDWLWSTVVDRIYGTGNTTLAPITTLSSTTNSISTIDDRRPFIKITYTPGGPCTSPPTPGTATTTASGVCIGTAVTLNLTGNSSGTGQTYQWESGPAAGGPFTPFGSSQATPSTIINPTTTLWYRAAVTCSGNTQNSVPVEVVVNPAFPGGTYTINSGVATGGTNYQTFADAVSALSCGIAGPITFNVAAASGPYNEQVIIPAIGGSSAVNTITFNGNGTIVSDNGTAVTGQRAVFKLDGADYITINNFVINTGTGTYGYGVQLLNDADHNTISNCVISTNNSSTSTINYAGVLINSTPSAITTTGASLCDSNTVIGNTITGGYAGVAIVANTTTSQVFGNKILNNTITDFYSYGIYLNGNVGTLIEGNDISRPLRSTVTTFYGVYYNTISLNTIINANKFHDPFGGNLASTSAAYAIDHVNCDATAGNENIVSNNLVYNFIGGTGTQNGFLSNNSDYITYYHNTVAIEDATATCTTCASRGFYQQGTATGLTYKNNIVTIKRGGTGDKQSIFFEQASLAGVSLNNNDYYFYPGVLGLQEIGRLGGTGGTGYTTIAAWQAGSGQEAGSVSLDPLYQSIPGSDYHPTAGAMDNLGTPVGILTDITGATRSVTTPDMGAYEFTVTSGIDMSAQSLVTPAVASNGCYTSAETVTIKIRNSSTSPIDLSVNPVTVTTNVTGAVTQTLTAVVNTGTLAPAATLDVPMSATLNMGATGVYTFNAFTTVAGDVVPGNDAMAPVDITKAVLAAGTASVSPGSYCITPGTPTLSTTGADGYGSLQWQQSTTPGVGFTNIPGANTSPYTLASPITQTMYFRLIASCNGNNATSNEVSVTLSNPQITGTTPGAACGPGPVSVTLAATGTGNTSFNWYDVPSGGTVIGTGSPFNTPPISANTTYYVSATTGGVSANVGLPAQLAGTSGAGTTNFGLVFDALVPFRLNSVVVYPIAASAGTAGTVTIDVVDGTGAVLNTATVNVVGNPVASATAQTVMLNFDIAAGTNLKLRPGSRGAGITGLLFEPSASAPPGGNYGYPFTVPGVVTINHSTLTAPPTNTPRLDLYYYFYNWDISTGCESGRTAVAATITTPPAATISYTGSPYCTTAGTATVTQTGTAGGTYSAAPAGLTINPTTGAITLATSAVNSYTVTYTIPASAGCPVFTTTASVTVASCAGPVTVTASAGTPGPTPYNTVKLAFDAINAGTHQGDIIVNINGNTDEGATPAILNSSGAGAAVYTSVLVRPTADGLSVTGSATPANRAIIELNGADNVIIDGDNPGTTGTNRNLTFELTTTNAAAIIWLKTASTTDGCLNNIIRNCNLLGQGTYASIAGVIAGSGTFGGAAQTANSNNTLQNNTIKRVQNGLYQNGFGTSPYDVNWQIRDNIIGSTVLADKMGFRGMILINASAYVVNNNTIMGINSSTATTSTMTGIQLGTGNLNGTISNNRISDIKHNNTAGWGSNGIWLNASTVASNTNVFNNFVSDIASAGFGGNAPTDNGYGIVASAGGGYNIYYNTVLMNTNQPNATGRAAAFLTTTGIATNNTLNVRNNIFANTQSAGAQRYSVFSGATAARFLDVNYNDYYTASGANLGNIGGTDRADLAAWQAGTGKDALSLSVAPVFVSATDLHLAPASNCGLDGKGTAISTPAITTDIDGDTRNATTPDIGADEFTGLPPAASIVYTGSPYCSDVAVATVTRTGTAGGTYSAAPAGLTINATTGDVTPGTSTPGTYTVTYTIPPVGGCLGATATTSITITAAPNAIIFYSGDPYCQNGGTANVTQSGTPGGTYSSTPGLTINPATGTVNLGLSTPGTYTVTYTVAASGGCNSLITQAPITITAAPNATISYAGSPYCQNAGTATVTRTGTAGGTYSSTAGLTINPATGAVTLGTSTAGTYTVTYSVAAAGGCAAFITTTSITITALPAATISYTSSPYCQNSGTANVTRTGTAGGTYSSTAGLSINATTGAVTLATSTPGTYIVTYTIAAGGGCAVVTATASITITALPAATISYAGSPYCQNSGTANVTRTGTAGGTYSSTAGLTINAATGDVNLANSTPGTYTVTYTIAAGSGCPVVTATTTITVSSLSVAPTGATASAANTCGPVTVTLTVTGGTLGSGAAWKWYSGTCGGTAAGTGATINVTANITTTYFVRAEGACNTTTCASVTVTVNTEPTISIAASPGTVLKPFVTTTLTATVAPATGTSITWYRNGNVVPGATGTTLVVNVDGLGEYTARATTSAGCNSLSNAVTITAEGANQLFVTPNPNHGQFKVRFYSSRTSFGFLRHLVMYSENGQKVFDKTYPITAPYSSMDIDARLLPKGIYVIMLTDAYGKEVLATGKVVIQ